MAGEYPFLSGVRSNLIEEQIQEQSLPPSADAIIIFGTATKGPLYTPTRVTPASVESIFGTSVSDPYEKFNLLKGFHEINGTFPRADIIAVRIGNAKKASLTLYEHQVTSGIYAPQAVDTASVTLSALAEGNDGNAVTADIYGDTQGIPTRMIVGLPTGSSVEFDLANQYKTPSLLAQAMNADDEVSQFIKTTPNVLSTSGTVTIIEHPSISGQIQTTYSLAQNNILDITAAYIQSEYDDVDVVPAGRSSATLTRTPIKDQDPNTVTISQVFSIIRNEIAFGPAEPGDIGETSVVLDAASDVKFDNTELNSVRSLVVRKKSGVTGVTTTLELTTDYTFTVSTATILLNVGLVVGDVIYADYEYLTTFAEANVRSALETGNSYSYFIGGNVITFGATQTNPLSLVYNSKSNFAIPGDISLSSAVSGTVRFSINENSPAIGDVVSFEYVFEPELPAPNQPTGTVLPSGKRQASQLTGGTDGRALALAEYYNELAKGYIAADNIPFRIAVPQGVYIDDVMTGVDFETGYDSEMNAGFHNQLSLFLQRHSLYVSECVGIMSVKPMVSENPAQPSLEEREDWYDKLVNVSATDVTRAANVVSSIQDYHLVATVGDFIWAHPAINGGRLYVDGGANMFAGMKFFHDNLTSIVTRNVPKTVIRTMPYKIVSADRLNALIGMRYTVFTEDSDTGNFKAAAAPTLAASTSQFRKQYNLDITIEAINRVRRVLKPFIGQPNKNSVREAMKQAAKQELQLMSPNKLMAFDINIIATRNEAINGRLQVELTLTTAVEIIQINVRTRLQLGF
jgi:hypothetical protein